MDTPGDFFWSESPPDFLGVMSTMGIMPVSGGSPEEQGLDEEEFARLEAEAATLSFSEAVAKLDRLHDEDRGDSDEAEIIRNCPAFEAGKVILKGGELTLVEGDPSWTRKVAEALTPLCQDRSLQGALRHVTPTMKVMAAELDRLRAVNAELLAALKEIKIRIAFIGMPQEDFWEPEPGRRLPDWRKQIGQIEAAITNATRP